MLLTIYRLLGKGVFLCAFPFIFQVYAGKVRLQWDASPDLVVTRYRVYASADRSNFGPPVALTFGTRAELDDLREGHFYYIAVTGVDLFGNESDFSNIVTYYVPIFPPTAESKNITVLEDSTSEIILSGTDVHDDQLAFSLQTYPANGQLIGTPPFLMYQPNSNFYGVDHFTYIVSDGVSTSPPATVTIHVTEQNDPPTLDSPPTFTSMRELDSSVIRLSGITSGDSNEAQPLIVTAISSNPDLVKPTILYSNPDSTGILILRSGESNGLAVITVAVSDGQSSNNSVQSTFLVFVKTPPPAITDIVEQSNDARSLTIQWRTDQTAYCVVEYGPTIDLGFVSGESIGMNHALQLPNLQPDTTYYLRVRASNSGGSSVSSMATASTEPVHVVAFSAETGQITAPMSVVADSAVQNGRYIVSPYNSGSAVFPVNVPNGLNYQLWGLVKVSIGGGSFYVSADGGAESLVQVPQIETADGWSWQLVSTTNASGSNPLLLPLSAGSHEIAIRPADPNIAIDEFFLSNDPLWKPTLAGTRPTFTISGASIFSPTINWTEVGADADSIGIEWSIDGVNFAPLMVVPSAWSSVGVQSLLSTSILYFRIYAFNSTDRTDYSNVVQRPRLL